MVRLDGAGRVAPFIENASYRRQDLPPLYIPDGGVIAVTRQSLFTTRADHPHAFLGTNRRGVISAGPVIDVDTAHDFAIAEALLSQHAGTCAT
jgi:CMP-N-acetylneuraminic acid synthetase